MLIRNRETKLFQSGDFNVRVTVFDRNPKHYVPAVYKSAWIETIRDALGGGILDSKKVRGFTIYHDKMRTFYLFNGTGKELISKINAMFQKPKSLRISIIDGDREKTWVIIIP